MADGFPRDFRNKPFKTSLRGNNGGRGEIALKAALPMLSASVLLTPLWLVTQSDGFTPAALRLALQ